MTIDELVQEATQSTVEVRARALEELIRQILRQPGIIPIDLEIVETRESPTVTT